MRIANAVIASRHARTAETAIRPAPSVAIASRRARTDANHSPIAKPRAAVPSAQQRETVPRDPAEIGVGLRSTAAAHSLRRNAHNVASGCKLVAQHRRVQSARVADRQIAVRTGVPHSVMAHASIANKIGKHTVRVAAMAA